MSTTTISETACLRQEHQEVLHVLDDLEKSLDLAPQNPAQALDGIRQGATYLAEDLERHLVREEKGLFPLLEEKIGLAGPLQVMLLEHETLRQLTRSIRTDAMTGIASPPLTDNIRRILQVLRDHVAKEDGVLFPMAERFLTPTQLADLERKQSR